MAHDLLSLITVLQQDRVHKRFLVESLLEKVTSLKSLLEKSATTMQHRLKGGDKDIFRELQSEIRDAAHEAEDIIESRAVDQMLSKPKAIIHAISEFIRPDHSISKVIEKFDAAHDKLANLIVKLQTSHDEGDKSYVDVFSYPSFSAAAADQETNTASMMVGFEEDAVRLKGRLTSDRRKREIIPIVGMGGIGKTTLARNLYNDPLVVSHFDVCAWGTVSQDYNARALLLGLLGSMLGNFSEDMLRENDSDLGDTLYRRLCGRRYLVVLDDIWSEKAWDEIRRYFPNEENRSRILITSRDLRVAKHPDSACEEHRMHLLSYAQGWELLRRKVFKKDEHCTPFLEEIGRKIATDCRGLPLAISVIGGLLYADKYSEDLWVRVSRDVRSITGDHTSEILGLSYDNLPIHLRPCFLYMSAFPEDDEVPHSILVLLFAAEGFLWRSNADDNKTLEDVAGEYLKALVDRNLLSITRSRHDGRRTGYKMHDLLRDLCVKKAQEEKFLSVFKHWNINSFRRGSVHLYTKGVHDLSENLSRSRSLLFIARDVRQIDISSILSSLRLVRVLNVDGLLFDGFPIEIIKLVNLRFLGIHFNGSVPSALWRLRNLQTLLLYSWEPALILPYEACENISGLRHIVVSIRSTIYIDFEVSRAHENLQTISGICLRNLLSSNLINYIPNIKELKIRSHESVPEERIIDLSHLHKLETLELTRFKVPALSVIELPNNLKELSLHSCTLPKGLVNGVGDLQCLEVLKISFCTFQSEEEHIKEEWELDEGVELCSLQFLVLHRLAIKRWKADYSHFPILSHLRIVMCRKLEELPACVAEMSTLEKIEVQPRHADWANEVRETQLHEYGNETLQISVIYAAPATIEHKRLTNFLFWNSRGPKPTIPRLRSASPASSSSATDISNPSRPQIAPHLTVEMGS